MLLLLLAGHLYKELHEALPFIRSSGTACGHKACSANFMTDNLEYLLHHIVIGCLIKIIFLFYFARDESTSRNASIRKWNLKFQRSPVEFLPMPAGEKLSGVRFEVNNLVEVCFFISVVSNVIQGFILYPLLCVINILGYSNEFLNCFVTYFVTLHLKFQPPSQDEKIYIVSIISNLFALTLQSTFSLRDGFY